MTRRVAAWLGAVAALSLPQPAAASAKQPVAVLALSDALDPALLDSFSRQTGLPVTVDPFLTPDSIEGTLRASRTGYDLVLAPMTALDALASRLMPLADVPEMMAVEPAFATADTAARAVAFDWYPIGIAVNAARLRRSDLDGASGMALLVRPELLRKAGTCGIGVPDRPREVYAALASDADVGTDRRRGLALLAQVQAVARRATDEELADNLAQGNLCAAMLPAPAAAVAMAAAQAADDGVALAFVVPDHGATVVVDALALPSGGRNPDGGRALLRFLLAPDHAAANARRGHVASALRGGAGAEDGLFDRSVLARSAPVPALDQALSRAIDSESKRAARR